MAQAESMLDSQNLLEWLDKNKISLWIFNQICAIHKALHFTKDSSEFWKLKFAVIQWFQPLLTQLGYPWLDQAIIIVQNLLNKAKTDKSKELANVLCDELWQDHLDSDIFSQEYLELLLKILIEIKQDYTKK